MELISFPGIELTQEQLLQMQEDLGEVFCFKFGDNYIRGSMTFDVYRTYDVIVHHRDAVQNYINQNINQNILKKHRHVHADLMIAYANDPSIQIQYRTTTPFTSDRF